MEGIPPPSIFQTQPKSKWIVGRLASGSAAALCAQDATCRAKRRNEQNRRIEAAFRADHKKRRREARELMARQRAFAAKHHDSNQRPASRQAREEAAKLKADQRALARERVHAARCEKEARLRQRNEQMPARQLSAVRSQTVCEEIDLQRLALRSGSTVMGGQPRLRAESAQPGTPPMFMMLSPLAADQLKHRVHGPQSSSVPCTAPALPGNLLPSHTRAATTPLRNNPPARRRGVSNHIFSQAASPKRRVLNAVRGGTPEITIPPPPPAVVKRPAKHVAARTDCGAFRVDESNPARCPRTGVAQTFEEVYHDAQQLFGKAKTRSKPLRRMVMSIAGMEVADTGEGRMIDLSSIQEETGFEQSYLDALSKDFCAAARCRLDLLVKDEGVAKIDWPQFRVCMRKRLMSCDALAKRIFEIADDEKTHTLTLRQLCRGLVFFQPNPTAIDKINSPVFLETCNRFMDIGACGIVSKLSMYTVCDTAFDKEDSYLLSDSIWEVLTPVGAEMRSQHFTARLAESEQLRQVFYKLMLLQGLEHPSEDYEEERMIHGPIYVYEMFQDTHEELMQLTHSWRETKRHGRFFYLEDVVRDFCISADARKLAGRDEVQKVEAEKRMHEQLRKALDYQDTTKGKDNMRVGHYCKVMLGIQEKGMEFLKQETSRVQELLSTTELSEQQMGKFSHLMHILQYFTSTHEMNTKK